jgi:hypothetical protein
MSQPPFVDFISRDVSALFVCHCNNMSPDLDIIPSNDLYQSLEYPGGR